MTGYVVYERRDLVVVLTTVLHRKHIALDVKAQVLQLANILGRSSVSKRVYLSFIFMAFLTTGIWLAGGGPSSISSFSGFCK